MKLSIRQLKKIIKEMAPAFPVGILDDRDYFEKKGIDHEKAFKTMADTGISSLSIGALIEVYLKPYKNRIKFRINSAKNLGIDISMYLDGNQIGYIGADFVGDMCSDCYMVGLSSTAAGEIKSKKVVHGFQYELIQDKLFKEGSYGPILYELCLELTSKMGDDSYLTCDKHSLEPEAYNVWAYYLYERDDIIIKQLDPTRVPIEFRITPNDPTDDCDTGKPPSNDTAEEYYMNKTSRLVHPQGPDDDPKGMYKAYTDYLKSEDPIMKGYRKNTFPLYDFINKSRMIM